MNPKEVHKPMTAAERQRKRRQKMKNEGTYESYKKKHAEEVRNMRKKQKEALLKLPKSTQNKIQQTKRIAVKNQVDGIGGSVKRQVWGAVSSRKHIVVDAPSFVAAANATSNVKVSLITDSEIDNRNKTLHLKQIFENSEPVLNIMKIHQLIVNDGKLKVHKLSNKSSSEDEPPKVGDWYFVEYENKLYPGEIKEINDGEEEYKIETMEAIGKYWKWPNKSDIIFYTNDKLIKKVGQPIVVNSRGHFKFE